MTDPKREAADAKAKAAIDEVYRELESRGVTVQRGTSSFPCMDKLDGLAKRWLVPSVEVMYGRISGRAEIRAEGVRRVVPARTFKESDKGIFNVKTIVNYVVKCLDAEKAQERRFSAEATAKREVRAVESETGGMMSRVSWERYGDVVYFKVRVPVAKARDFFVAVRGLGLPGDGDAPDD